MTNPRLHLRRCHHCNHVNEVHGTLVKHCEGCGQELPSFYYFDELKAVGLKTEVEAALEYRSSALPWKEYPPILGLTAYWES